MYIKKFTGESLEDIQGRVNTELGPNAVILTTRTVESGFFQQLFFQEEYEVTVGVDPEDLQLHLKTAEKKQPSVTSQDKERLTQMASMQRLQPLGFQAAGPSVMKVPVTGPLKFDSDKKNFVVLVGSSGEGKLITMPKLALKLQQNTPHQVALISSWVQLNERIEQLQGLSRVLNLEHRIAEASTNIQQITNELPKHGIFLLDTPDTLDVVDIAFFIKELPTCQVLLVMSATATLDAQLDSLEKYHPLNPTGMLITHVDESPSLVFLEELTKRKKIPICYLIESSELKLANADDLEIRIINEKLRSSSL